MSEDIFVPLSKPQDAIVGPLDTITWLTNNSQDLEDILINGYLMTRNSWIKPKKDEQQRPAAQEKPKTEDRNPFAPQETAKKEEEARIVAEEISLL